jgi:hypothetical protein
MATIDALVVFGWCVSSKKGPNVDERVWDGSSTYRS